MNDHLVCALPLVFVLACGATATDSTTPSTAAAAATPADPSGSSTAGAASGSSASLADATATSAASPQATPSSAGKPASSGADASIAAGLSQDEIAKAVEAQGKIFDPCYKILGKKSARVKVKATVGPTGQVNAVDLVLSNSKNAKMDACVIEAFRKIKFPNPHGNSTATITFPMDFGGLEQVQ